MKAITVPFIACLFSVFQAPAQVQSSQLPEYKLESYKKANPRELVYIHSDKEVYAPGESASFKAYVHDYYSVTPSNLNGRLFMLLIDGAGNGVVNSHFIIDRGKTSGTLDLPQDLPDGKYTLIGLTGVMQQGSIKNVFSKEIFIKESFVPSTFIMLSTPEEICEPLGSTRVNVRLYTLSGKPYNKEFSYLVNLNGQTIRAGTDKADKTGRASIRVELPDYDDRSVAWVEVFVEQGDIIDRNSIRIPTQGSLLNLTFFPEGGNLIHGINTVVGFTAFNHFDEPIHIEGDLVDANNNVVGNIASLTGGLGSFSITPDKANPLKVQITKPESIPMVYDLPEITASGISLQFSSDIDSELQFEVISGQSELEGPIRAVAEKNGRIAWSTVLPPVSNTSFSIPASDLGAGIIRVALLNERGQLRAHRAVFVNNEDPKIAVKQDKSRYDLKDNPNLQVKHQNNPAEPFDCSISVTDSRLNPNWNNAQDIFSYFTIGPSAGKFDFPTGYFLATDVEKEKIMDCLMLTEPNRFDWVQIYSGEGGQSKPILPSEFMARLMEDLRSDERQRLLAGIENDQFIYKYVLSQDRGIPGYFWENRKALATGTKPKLPSRQERIRNQLRAGTPLLDVLKQIKHYSLTANKIIFGGPNSLVNQDGALIVVDGIKLGTEASILNTINPMDVQNIEVFTDPNSMARYTSLNGVGVISITTFGKDTPEEEEDKTDAQKDDKALLLWDPLLELQPNEVVEIPIENKDVKTDYTVLIQGTDKLGRPLFSTSQFSVY